MTGRRGYRRRRNSASSIFPGMNTTSYQYQGSNQYPYSQYISGTGGGYPTGSSTSGLSSLFSIFRSNYRSTYDMNMVICNGFRLVDKFGYLLLKDSEDLDLIQIDCEGMHKYHFSSSSGYDTDEDGALIILDEGSL